MFLICKPIQRNSPSVSEGELDDDATVTTSNETSVATIESPEPSPKRARFGRVSKRQSDCEPNMSSSKTHAANPACLAGTGLRPIHEQPSSHTPWKEQSYLAGGNQNRQVRQRVLQNQAIQSLRWNKDDFLNKGGLRSTRQILLVGKPLSPGCP